VLILPPGHAQAARVGRRLTLREKRIVAGVGVLTAALIVAIVISLLAAGKTSGRGCIYVTIPAATGAEQINQCGEPARATCLSTSTPGAFAPEAARAVAAECRKAGLPVG
jgi:predicted acylesterase/phospholipase RssA